MKLNIGQDWSILDINLGRGIIHRVYTLLYHLDASIARFSFGGVASEYHIRCLGGEIRVGVRKLL